jgi:hypothetical protein
MVEKNIYEQQKVQLAEAGQKELWEGFWEHILQLNLEDN